MNTVFRITLDIHKLGSQAVIPCFQGDSGYTIIARLTENGMPFTIEDGCTAIFQAKKPDEKFLYNSCVIDNNTIVYDFLATVKDGETCQTTAKDGSMDCQFKLIGANGGILASPLFKIVVSKCVYNEEEVLNSVSEATALSELVVDLNAKLDSGYFNGEKGEDGTTPVRGEDYWTEGDQLEIVNDVLSKVPIRKGSGESSAEIGVESNKATGARSFAGGNGATAPGSDGFSYGLSTIAGGKHSAAFNSNAKAAANDTFATGEGTFAGSNVQRVAGKFNEKDTEGKYADIVGNGSSDTERSNAYALDWEGNATYAGSVTSKDGELTTKGKVLDELFPFVVESREDITAQASWYALPSDDAKIELHAESSYIYICDANYNEPVLHFKDGATSPYLLPDDLADQDMAATYWKAGNHFEGVTFDAAYLLVTKEQTDKTALSPSRLPEILQEATETKTFYIPVARINDNFALTEEMKENGLVIRRNAPNNDFVSATFTIWSPEGSLVGEPSAPVPTKAGAVLPFDVSGYEVGSQFQFYGWTDYSYGGNLEVQMPVTMEYVSKDKLAALLGSE